MGKLRVVPRDKEPGFMKFQLNDVPEPQLGGGTPGMKTDSNISIKTRQGTLIEVGREVPLKQVARLVKMLECRRPHGLG